MPTPPIEYPLEVPLPPKAILWKLGDPLPPPIHALIIEPIQIETGEVWEAVELSIYTLRQRYPNAIIGFHLTGWYAGVAYAALWGIDFLLYHPPTMQKWWGLLPEGHEIVSIMDWRPPPPWKLLGNTYHPSIAQVEALNALLISLQNRRRSLSHFHPERSTLLRTLAGGITHFHRTLEEHQRFLGSA